MSRHEQDPNQHDFFVSLAITQAMAQYPDHELVQADGGLPYSSHIVPCTSKILSYRPDAVLTSGESHLIVEVKSIEDIGTDHSKKQFRSIRLLLEMDDSYSLLLLIFGNGLVNISLNPELQALLKTGRVEIIPVTDRVGAHETL